IDKFSSRTTVFSGSNTLHEARYPNMKDDGTDAYYSNLTTTVDPYSSIMLQGPLKDIVNGFKTTKNMKISGYLRTGWLVDTFLVKEWDGENSIITFDFENYPFDNGYKLDQFELMYEGRTTDLVFFHNLADQLDVKGEYWFDEDTQQLYVYDVKGDYAISQGGTIASIYDCDYITLSGFNFICSAGTTVGVTISDHVTVSDCTFAYISGNQCLYSWGSNYVTFEYNEAYSFICGGIMTNEGGNLHTLEESHNVVRNNYVHDFGHPSYFSSSGGIILWNSVGAIAEHNVLENGVHGGIVFGGVDNVIQYNVLNNMVSNTKDYGAVYGGGIAHRGNKIRYNLIMNLDTSKEAYGVYIDECGSGQEVYGNIFYDAGAHAVTLNGGRENNVSENIIINSEHGDFLMNNEGLYQLIMDNTPEAYPEHMAYAYLINERAAEGTPGYEAWVNRFPEVYSFNVDPSKVGDADCLFTTINTVKNNTVIGSKINYGIIYEMFAVKDGTVAYGLDWNDMFVDPT
ncbi:MAG: right-handed parallel beta-helix repeat-containing protein, partial [Clostridia bacterium]|nr:right-handed parallel beta-helix repeat-containing protein [Clostridia bacterium]